MKQQCAQAVAKALGKPSLNQQEIQNIEQRIRDAMKNKAREDINKWRGLSEQEKLTAAAEQVAKDIEVDKQRKLQLAKQDILKQSKNIADLDHANLPASEVIDRMIANHGDMSGVQSVSTKARAIASIYRSDLVEFYTSIKGGLGIFTDKDLVRSIVQERFGVDSGNPLAKSISTKMGDTFENMRDRFNRNGGDIGKLDDWGMPQSHDSAKMATAGKDQWVDDAMGHINREKYVHEDGTYYSDDEIIELLRYAFDSITSNGANKIDVGRVNHQGTSKVTKKHAESRVLHFKDADAWIDYQSKYGGQQFVDVVESHIQSMSKDIAMVETFGSNPRNALKILTDAARKKDWENGIPETNTDKTLKRAQVMFDDFASATSESQLLANMGLTYRSLNVASMLGGTTLASITDQAMIAKTAHVHGLSYKKAFSEILGQLNPKNKEDRELARSIGIATEEMLGSINRWADDGLTSVHGKSEKIARASNTIASQVLRLSGLNALTAASKTGFTKLLMNKYAGMTRTKNWTDLSDIDRALLEGTGLNERAWKVMQAADPIVDRKGNNLMTARSIYEISDEKIIAAMDDDVRILMDDITNQIDELNTRNLQDDQHLTAKSQRIEDTKREITNRLSDYANKRDAKSQAEKQALQDRIDLLDAQKEAAAAQADINTYLQAEKQSGRIQDFLQQVESGRHSDLAASDARRNIERNARQYNSNGERLGQRIGNAERRMVELRAKMRQADSEANKAITQKFSDLDQRINKLDNEFIEYQAKNLERQERRQKVMDRLSNSIDDQKRNLAKNIRDEIATRLQAHYLDEQGMAVIEAGLRERTMLQGGGRGTIQGELWRSITQFKSFPTALMMRHGSRGFSRPNGKGKAAYLMPLIAMTTLLGGLVVQLREIVGGNDPLTMYDSNDPEKTMEFFKRSMVQGGGLSFLGDILAAGTDVTGKGATSFASGVIGNDFQRVLALTVGNATQAGGGVETNWENEAFQLAKSKTPGQNLWYTKAVMNRLLFDEIQDTIAPGYREKALRRAESKFGRTRWWGDDIGDIETPDFERVVE